jgi:nitronate monooxygenase
MKEWVDIALEEGVRFFITALGKPDWVVEKVHAVGGVVYHDVTERKFALKAIESGVDGLICVNNRAGGHAGKLSPVDLYAGLSVLGLPLVLAGGVGDANGFKKAFDIGYAGVQVGTRFIATNECSAHEDYKMAILNAKEEDIVLTEKLSGVPVSIIKTEYVEKTGTKAGFFARLLLKGSRSKHWMRMFYTLLSFFSLRKASLQGGSYKEYFQAGKSVKGIESVESVETVVQRFAAMLD